MAARGWLLLGASLQGVRVGRLEGIAVELGEEVPVCELEVIGLIRCDSVNQISEVLWRRTVTSGGAHLRGLALQIRTIADFLFSLSLWISWVLLSLGELVYFLILEEIIVAFFRPFLGRLCIGDAGGRPAL